MKKVGYLLSCAALVATLSGVISVYAQDAVDPTSLDYVTKAYTNTLASTSLHIESQSVTQSADQQQGAGAGQQQTASFDVAKAQDAWNVSGTRTIKLTTQAGEVDITLDSIVVDGELYMQITGMPQFGQGGQGNGGQGQGNGAQPPAQGQDQGQGGGQGQGNGGQFTIPQGWFDATQMAANNQRVPGVGVTDAKTFVLTLLDALNLPVTTQSVIGLKELPADTVDGQSMRVFQLTLDPATILQSDVAALLNGGGFAGGFGRGGGFGGGRPGNGGQGGGQGNGAQAQVTPPGPGTPFPTRTPPNPADYQVTFAIYVGDQDQLIHRIYSVIAVTPSATDATGTPQAGRTITTQTDFTKFNAPVTITAPQITPASS